MGVVLGRSWAKIGNRNGIRTLVKSGTCSCLVRGLQGLQLFNGHQFLFVKTMLFKKKKSLFARQRLNFPHFATSELVHFPHPTFHFWMNTPSPLSFLLLAAVKKLAIQESTLRSLTCVTLLLAPPPLSGFLAKPLAEHQANCCRCTALSRTWTFKKRLFIK